VAEFVMAGLAPAIHVFVAAAKTWMPGTRLRKGFAALAVLARRSFSEAGQGRA
jgi:hypothetical protein